MGVSPPELSLSLQRKLNTIGRQEPIDDSMSISGEDDDYNSVNTEDEGPGSGGRH